jgi:hypothetical protein
MNKARLWLAAALCIGAWPASAINIVDNPGFEAAGTSWQSLRFSFAIDPTWAHSGPGEARSGCNGAWCLSDYGQGSYLRQVLPTVAGEQYDIGFWVRSYTGVGEYAVYWDGARIDDKVIANGPMPNETYNNLTASTVSTTLEIHGRNDAAWISFDDITVMPGATTAGSGTVGLVPEPLPFAMLAAGLALVGYTLRRRKR